MAVLFDTPVSVKLDKSELSAGSFDKKTCWIALSCATFCRLVWETSADWWILLMSLKCKITEGWLHFGPWSSFVKSLMCPHTWPLWKGKRPNIPGCLQEEQEAAACGVAEKGCCNPQHCQRMYHLHCKATSEGLVKAEWEVEFCPNPAQPAAGAGERRRGHCRPPKKHCYIYRSMNTQLHIDLHAFAFDWFMFFTFLFCLSSSFTPV